MSEILVEIRRRKENADNCAGHRFVAVSNEEMVGARRWKCIVCLECFDAHEASMYLQGVRHAEKGHTFTVVFPKEGA